MKMVCRLVAAAFVIMGMGAGTAMAHCQIPCGIYDDDMRFHQIEEHIITIEKSMKAIVELSGEDPIDYNQLVRWVTNKDAHAGYIEEIVSYYFLAQRVKPVPESAGEVALLHKLLVEAMKAKQSTDLAVVARLRELLSDFEKSYREARE